MGKWLVHNILERQAYWGSDNLAISYEETEYSYAELNQRANQFARALVDSGFEIGDKIVAHGKNHADLIAVYFACSKIGAIFSPISTLNADADIEFMCDTLNPKLVLYTPDESVQDTLSTIRSAVPDAQYVSMDSETVAEADVTAESFIDGYGTTNLDRSNELPEDTHHFIYWTSGTTGQPKGVVRNHPALLQHSDLLLKVIPMGEFTNLLIEGNMMYGAAYHARIIPTVKAGGSIYILRDPEPAGICEMVQEHGINHLPIGFTRGQMLYDYVTENDLSIRIKRIQGALPSAAHAENLSELCDELYHSYAATEVGRPLATRVEPPFDGPPELGKPIGDADIRLVDPDNRTAIPTEPPSPGDMGELAVRGNVVMTSYLKEEHQKAAVHNGWAFPGDMFRINEKGNLVFAGRVDNRLRSGGVNVFPGEVESVLDKHPDVEEAIVVGVDDEKWGDKICALITTRIEDTERLERELDEYCKDNPDLARELRPKAYAFVRSSEDVPTAAHSKVDREAIKTSFF